MITVRSSRYTTLQSNLPFQKELSDQEGCNFVYVSADVGPCPLWASPFRPVGWSELTAQREEIPKNTSLSLSVCQEEGISLVSPGYSA